MGPVIAVPVVLAFIMGFLFFRLQPQHDNIRAVRIYNAIALALGAGAVVVWYFSWLGRLVALGREKYIDLFCIGGGAAVAFFWLLLAFLVRNYYIFKNRSLII